MSEVNQTETAKSGNGHAAHFEGKMPVKEFVETAIKNLRKPPYKSIHVVYSGFNPAFRKYYGEDPRPYIDALVAEGFLVKVLVKGGCAINLASELTEAERSTPTQGDKALQKILGG